MFQQAQNNNWTVQEIDFTTDIVDIKSKITASERHMMSRLLSFWSTADSLVGNNLVQNIFNWVNSPEARLYLARQLFEESLHVSFYNTALELLVSSQQERDEAFDAIKAIPSIRRKGEFFHRWMQVPDPNHTMLDDTKCGIFLRNLICFATAIEGIFLFSSFVIVYYLRSRGLFHGLALGTAWSQRDESAHIEFALEIVKIIKSEYPRLFNSSLESDVRGMIKDAVECEYQFAEDTLKYGVSGLSLKDMRSYLEYIANQRLNSLGYTSEFVGARQPFAFLDLQDVQPLTNQFERRSAEYQVGVTGTVRFDADF